MSDIDNKIDWVKREVVHARILGHVEEEHRHKLRLEALYREREEAIAEQLAIHAQFNRDFAPKPAKQLPMVAMGPDEYLSGDWIVDESNRTKRPNA